MLRLFIFGMMLWSSLLLNWSSRFAFVDSWFVDEFCW
jgi:hypothetical protein